MKLPNIRGVVDVVKTFAMANRPEILLGAAITATAGSVVLAAKGGYEARGIVIAEEETLGRPLDNKEKLKLTWLCYIPATVAATTAIGSTCGLHLIHVKDKKALATAGMAALEEAKKSAKEFEKENLGVLTDEEKEKILGERVDDDGKVRIETSDHELEELYLVRDGYSGRDIWSNQHRIEDALIELNNVLNGSGDAELNHFYTHAGFNHIPNGTNYGWSGALVSLDWKETKRDDGRPVREFSFRPSPEKGFDDAHQ